MNFAATLHSSYLNLGSASEGLLHTEALRWTAEGLRESRPTANWVQRQMSAHFRTSLVDRAGDERYRVKDPRELVAALRTPEWDLLCSRLDHWNELGAWQRVWVARVLLGLCLHALVVEITEPATQDNLDEPAAQLASARVTALIARERDGYASSPMLDSEIQVIQQWAPEGSPARVNAVCQRILRACAVRDAVSASAAVLEGVKVLDTLDLQQVDSAIATSRFHRAAAMEPMLRNDSEAVAADMAIAESTARQAIAVDDESLMARENMYSLLESRTKEQLQRGELAKAERYARELTDLSPLDAKAWIELGEVVGQRGDIRSANECYMRALSYGPPGEAIAWFMAGQCAELLGRDAWADLCFTRAVGADPGGVSAYRRLAASPRAIPAVRAWAELRAVGA